MVMKTLNILSFGYTRDLLSGDSSTGDTFDRLKTYSELVNKYFVVAHSLKSHNVLNEKQISDNFWVYSSQGSSRLDSGLKQYKLGQKIIKKYGINLIQAQDPYFTGVIAYLLSKRYNIPFNVCVYGTNPYDPYFTQESTFYSLCAFIAKAVLRSANGVQVDGRKIQKDLIANGINSSKIYYKPMIPIGLERFFELTPHVKNTARPWHFLFVGRLVFQKNVSMLLRVIQRLRGQGYYCRLKIIGEGNYKQSLEELSDKLCLSDVVDFVGSVFYTEIPKYFDWADVFLLPSNYEGFPRVIMEAAAAGLPIVATDVSGAGDIILQEETGYIVPLANEDIFLEKTKVLLAELENSEWQVELSNKTRSHMKSIAEQYLNLKKQVSIWQEIAS